MIKSYVVRPVVGVLAFVAFGSIIPLITAQQVNKGFAPLQEWKSAVLKRDGGALKALYSTTPAAQLSVPAGPISAAAEISFWSGLKANKLDLDVLETDAPRSGLEQVVFQAEIHSNASSGPKTIYIVEGQIWQQQGESWKLVATKRSDPTRLQQPASLDKEIYKPDINARAEIKEAIAQALKSHKRVLLIFGANWCYDCYVLDLAFHRPDLEPILQRDFEVVHIDVGQGDKNQDIMEQYQVPMKRGIPGLAVLDANGKLLFSQKNGEFEKARALAPADLLTFLNKWKPGRD